jgi:hypothetical protein
MIEVRFTGTLTHEPRPGQLTNELVNDSTRRALENPKLGPHMRAYYEAALAKPRPRVGQFSDGTKYTRLRLNVEGQRIEVTATGTLLGPASRLEPGAVLRFVCALLGEEPHFHLRAKRMKVLTPEEVAA